jgi:hypothetical protein
MRQFYWRWNKAGTVLFLNDHKAKGLGIVLPSDADRSRWIWRLGRADSPGTYAGPEQAADALLDFLGWEQ